MKKIIKRRLYILALRAGVDDWADGLIVLGYALIVVWYSLIIIEFLR